MTPNPSETPTGSQELATVLAEIAEIEEAPGYMGPKINRDIKEARWIFEMAEDVEYEVDEYGHRARVSIPDEWLWDIVVGEIGRACDARGWRIYLTGRYWPGKDALMCTIAGDERAIIRWGSSRALAAARAYLEAITRRPGNGRPSDS